MRNGAKFPALQSIRRSGRIGNRSGEHLGDSSVALDPVKLIREAVNRHQTSLVAR